MTDTSIKISELQRASSINEKDILPFSAITNSGDQNTLGIPLAILRLFLARPNVYATTTAAYADSKSGDYSLVYSDATKTAVNVYLSNGSSLSIINDSAGNNILLPLPSTASGTQFTAAMVAGTAIILPQWVVGTKGIKRIIVESADTENYFGEFIISKLKGDDIFTMSQSAVESENPAGTMVFTWDKLSPITVTSSLAGNFTFRIY